MDDNMKRKSPGSDHLHDAAPPQSKRVSVSAPKRSGSIIGMDCASPELAFLFKNQGEAFKHRRFADIILRVGADEFPAHKIILASRSDVFSRMLASNMKEIKEHIVDMIDIKASTVKAMLQYMYTGKTDEMSIDEVIDLYAAADRYGLLFLKYKCKNFIAREIDENHICDVAVLGDQHNDKDLINVTKSMLKKNPRQQFDTQKWEQFRINHPDTHYALIESLVVDQANEIAWNENNSRSRPIPSSSPVQDFGSSSESSEEN